MVVHHLILDSHCISNGKLVFIHGYDKCQFGSGASGFAAGTPRFFSTARWGYSPQRVSCMICPNTLCSALISPYYVQCSVNTTCSCYLSRVMCYMLTLLCTYLSKVPWSVISHFNIPRFYCSWSQDIWPRKYLFNFQTLNLVFSKSLCNIDIAW